MDNLTHSIIGLAVGELVHRQLPKDPDDKKQDLRRRLLWTAAWAASNFPDLDLFLGRLLPPPIGYLLHHRGHTHTLIYILPQALLLLAAIWLLWPAARQLLKSDRDSRVGFAIASLIGLGLHLLMDFFNSYGVHPFYPINMNWFYGDMVFIVEPFFWITLGLPLAFAIHKSWLKAFACAFLIVVPLFFTVSGYLHAASLVTLWLFALILFLIYKKQPKQSLNAGVLLTVIFLLGQSVVSKIAKSDIQQVLLAQDQNFKLLDVATNSYPSNPFCWMFTSVSADNTQGIYRMHRGLISLAPNLLPVSRCPVSLSNVAQQTKTTAQVTFLFSQDTSTDYLRLLKKEDCNVEAWLRFARAPLLGENQASDLRFYGFVETQNFSTMAFNLALKPNCSASIPPWGFPRADLLGE